MLINGVSAALISASDRGLQYGDGLFETLAVKDGSPCLWRRHVQRLCRGCDRLGIPRPDATVLAAEAKREAGGLASGVLKIILTRGADGRGYRPPRPGHPCRVLHASPWPDYPVDWAVQGVRIRMCNSRLGLNPDLAGVKHLNRLEQVMARSEWDDPHIAEGLMLDAGGRVIEGTMSNLFLVEGHRLITPRLGSCGVAGVVRELVLELARDAGLSVEIKELWPADVLRAKAAFLTNSLIGLWPVSSVEHHRLEVSGPAREFTGRVLAQVFSE